MRGMRSVTCQEFIATARRHFSYLPAEFNLPEQPLPDRKGVNPFQVRYANTSVLVIVEGYDRGYGADVALGPFKNPLGSIEPALPFWPLLKLRRPDLLESCKSARGQLAKLQACAIALRECASDVLSGDLTILGSVAEMLTADGLGSE
jgi:hypothetical protein